MAKVEITTEEVNLVSEVLRGIGTGDKVPGNLRANASMWADRMEPTMDRRDLERVAGLLRSVSKSGGVARPERRSARRWAAHIRARI
jgi:uncharacterized protein (UPF0147 family)